MRKYDSAPDNPSGFLAGWLPRPELARLLEVAEDTLKRWENQRIGPPCIRVGRKVLYRQEAVEEWLLDQERRKVQQKRGPYR